MRQLTVLTDTGCPLCRWVAGWLSGQRQLVPIRILGANSAEAHAAYPTLDHERTLEVMTVIDDEGNIYCDERAWLMCLWCTCKYRKSAQWFSQPAMLPFTSAFVKNVGKYRPRDNECEGSCATK